MKKLIKYAGIAALCVLFAKPVQAQDAQTQADKEAAYVKTVTGRAAKITASLGLNDESKAAKVTAIIAKQYQDLNNVYITRDAKLKEVKERYADNKQELPAALKAVDVSVAEQLKPVHAQYISNLSAYLTPEQVNKVKDGMTYNVLNVTYTAYNDMIPTLTQEQKSQIMTWLTEAREQSMDAESSEKKHAWFGKYKGRINNYLSAAGYDMKKEEAGWMERIKASKSNNK
ncbi:DUF3826 domain-containing protein [Mucilaginibacter lacusdianchii]|uniref:DUF3826 domain-containing protein n=1 Tax=Mucilaginibacter lacusdianchii TaxID=2684211 RepID=UPI00131E67AF|nr:DUF3826 domain-containing protein [Mucilaginibacter sp. JXJ CY 39]